MVEAMGGQHVSHPMREAAALLLGGGSEPYGLQRVAGPDRQEQASTYLGLEVRGQCGLVEEGISLFCEGYEPKALKSSV